MKIRIMLTLLGLGAITWTTLSTTVGAEEIIPLSPVDSNATIEFEAGDLTAPDLINPDDLDSEEPLEVDESIGDTTGQTGPLSLDYAPHLDFGTVKIDAKEKYYSAVSGENTPSPFVQVTDRRGTGTGWHLTANFTGFEKGITDEDGNITTTESLTGAEIIFSNPSESVTNGNQQNDKPIVTASKTSLVARESETFMNAPVNHGMGSWAIVWNDGDKSDGKNENIQLKVPGGTATVGTHTATITWLLTSGPMPE